MQSRTRQVALGSLKDSELPEPMRKMKPAEREKYLQKVGTERAQLQSKINDLNEKRHVYLADQAKKNAQANTLDQAILTSVKDEAAKKGFMNRSRPSFPSS